MIHVINTRPLLATTMLPEGMVDWDTVLDIATEHGRHVKQAPRPPLSLDDVGIEYQVLVRSRVHDLLPQLETAMRWIHPIYEALVGKRMIESEAFDSSLILQLQHAGHAYEKHLDPDPYTAILYGITNHGGGGELYCEFNGERILVTPQRNLVVFAELIKTPHGVLTPTGDRLASCMTFDFPENAGLQDTEDDKTLYGHLFGSEPTLEPKDTP